MHHNHRRPYPYRSRPVIPARTVCLATENEDHDQRGVGGVISRWAELEVLALKSFLSWAPLIDFQSPFGAPSVDIGQLPSFLWAAPSQNHTTPYMN